jgi:hypothetical protein
MNYKQIIGLDGITPLTNVIQRLPDMAIIPFDPQNVDYQAYLAWLEAGNQPEAADETPNN